MCDADDQTFQTFNSLIEDTVLLRPTHKDGDSEVRRKHNIDLRRLNLSMKVTEFRDFLKTVNLNTHKHASKILASLMILCKELNIETEFNPPMAKEYIRLLNRSIELRYTARLDDLLITGRVFDTQSVFDSCMDQLHQRLTPAEFRNCPFMIEVYCSFIKELNTYKVIVTPSKTLPIALILIDDYSDKYKRKGFSCFKTILQCAQRNSFAYGNYHEVIYKCLYKAINNLQMDEKILIQTLECFNEYLKALPNDLRKQTSNDTLYMILDMLQMSTTTRKMELFKFIKPLITTDVLKRQKVFERVMVDNLDQCTIDTIRGALLTDLLDCLQLWLKYCWCIWSYPTHHKLLSVLIKLLYAIPKDETDNLKHVEDLIITMIELSESKYQSYIVEQLELASQESNQLFKDRVTDIVNMFNVTDLNKKTVIHML